MIAEALKPALERCRAYACVCGIAMWINRYERRRPYAVGAPAASSRAIILPVGVVVVTHGQLAAELVNAAEAIVGDLSNVTSVSIGWHDDVDVAREEIGAAVHEWPRRPARWS